MFVLTRRLSNQSNSTAPAAGFANYRRTLDSSTSARRRRKYVPVTSAKRTFGRNCRNEARRNFRVLSFAEQAKPRRRPVWPVWRLLALRASKRRAGFGCPFGVRPRRNFRSTKVRRNVRRTRPRRNFRFAKVRRRPVWPASLELLVVLRAFGRFAGRFAIVKVIKKLADQKLMGS